MDHAEQHCQLCPRAVALVHRVGVLRGIFPQPVMEAGQRVEPNERLVARQQIALLGIQQEHQSQDHCEQRSVHGVGRFLQGSRQQSALGRVVGRLEPAQQFVQRVQDLDCQALADDVLVLPALLEERRQPRGRRPRQQPVLAQQQPHGRHDRPARRQQHVLDAEIEPSRTLAARGRNQADRPAVEDHARADAGPSQQPLHSSVRRGLQASASAFQGVEILVRADDTYEQLPFRISVRRRRPVPHRVVGSQDLLVLRQGHGKSVERVLRSIRAGERLWREPPVQNMSREGFEVWQPRLAVLPLLDAARHQPLPFAIIAGQDRSGPHERRGRDHKPVRLYEPQPVQVGLRVGIHQCHQFVSGQRYTSPSGSTRRVATL